MQVLYKMNSNVLTAKNTFKMNNRGNYKQGFQNSTYD
jgi:hypothetical protein